MTTKKQIKENESNKEKLKMGLFRAVFNSDFDGVKTDKIILNVKITRDLQYLLRSFILENEKVKTMIYDNKILRYKYNSGIFLTLNRTTREILFLKDLLDNGEVDIKIVDIETMERAISAFKLGFKYVIRTVLLGNQKSEVLYKTKIK